jgi:hypothetical protein
VALGEGVGKAAVLAAHYSASSAVVLHDFDVDDFDVARAQVAEFIAYSSSLAFVVKPLLPRVIGRPSSIPAGVPTGDRLIVPGSKCDAIGHFPPLSLIF